MGKIWNGGKKVERKPVMTTEEMEEHFGNLSPIVFCIPCRVNIERQEIGSHYRTREHKENHEERGRDLPLDTFEIWEVVKEAYKLEMMDHTITSVE